MALEDLQNVASTAVADPMEALGDASVERILDAKMVILQAAVRGKFVRMVEDWTNTYETARTVDTAVLVFVTTIGPRILVPKRPDLTRIEVAVAHSVARALEENNRACGLELIELAQAMVTEVAPVAIKNGGKDAAQTNVLDPAEM